MDSTAQAALVSAVEIVRRRGIGVLIATHDVELAAEIADRVAVLADGAVIADGTPRELLASGWHFQTEISRLTDGEYVTLAEAAASRLLAEAQSDVASPSRQPAAVAIADRSAW